MATKVQICNMALSYVGARARIESLSEATSEANACNVWYEEIRKEVLDADDWDFARRRVALAVHSENPPSQWAYRYAYPSDAIRVRRLERDNDQFAARFELDTSVTSSGSSRSIVTDEASAVAIYTRDEDNTALFTPRFVDALALGLAVKLCYTIVTDVTLLSSLHSRYSVALGLVQQEDGSYARPDSGGVRPLDRTDYTGEEGAKIRVANMALGMLGLPGSINSFSDTTREARQAAFWYDHCRQIVLKENEGGWPFATRRATLELHDDVPSAESGYGARYGFPSDCLRVVSLGDISGGEPTPYKVELDDDGDRTILADAGISDIVYVFDLEDMSKVPPDFRDAVAARMAVEMAPSYLTDARAISLVYDAYLLSLTRARGLVDSVNTQQLDAPWVLVRA